MHGMIDRLLVGAVLAFSVGYATYSLGPRALRQRAVASIARVLRTLPRVLNLQGAAMRLERGAAAKAKSACGGCDNCGSEQSPSATSSASEVSIPVSTIGRRTSGVDR